MLKGYEMVIGLEVHVELKTATKIFCGCKTDFGAPPNTQCCPVCTGMPGTLPVMNAQVKRMAIKAGLATHCEIAPYCKMDRKNYFYPDLPKAYQISQYDLPICSEGYLDIETQAGEKRIGITRIHMEEDAGKLIHDPVAGTMIDCNRCGVPLIEIVSEPDIRSAEEALQYLRMLRSVVTYTGISDGKMNEGSLRCDVNLSVRKAGAEAFGTRAEIKNLNSFQSVQKAIEAEYIRQVEAVEKGEEIVQETRRFDQQTGKTSSMRRKEDANDYRYFPDPDLMPLTTTPEEIAEIQAEIPALPWERQRAYQEQFGLSSYAAAQLVVDQAIADYFEEAARYTKAPVQLANLLISEVFRMLEGEDAALPIAPQALGELSQMLAEERINSSAGKRVIALLWEEGTSPEEIVRRENLYQINDEAALIEAVEAAIAGNPKLLSGYLKGKESLSKALMGQAMGKTGGKGNPVKLQRILEERLEALRKESNGVL